MLIRDVFVIRISPLQPGLAGVTPYMIVKLLLSSLLLFFYSFNFSLIKFSPRSMSRLWLACFNVSSWDVCVAVSQIRFFFLFVETLDGCSSVNKPVSEAVIRRSIRIYFTYDFIEAALG